MIYFIEDDKSINEAIFYTLKSSGFEVMGFEKPSDFWQAVRENIPKLIILDIMLPEEDGLHILRKLRDTSATKDIPIIMLTAKTSEYDKVIGLDSGADDYMTKPFNILEVKARIKSIFRRVGVNREAPKMELSANGLSINIGNRSATLDGNPVSLTMKEFDLLQLFMKNPGKVYSRDELLETIWGQDYIGDFRTVDVHIRRLREKIERDPANPEYILTKWGVGYYFAQ